MKNLLISILFILSFYVSLSQPVVNRASAANTVQDGNLFAQRSFGLPRFLDTIQANSLYPTLDSCGKLIYTYADNNIWKRSCSPKRWELIGGSSGSSLLFGRTDARNNTGNDMYFSAADQSLHIDSLFNFNVTTTSGSMNFVSAGGINLHTGNGSGATVSVNNIDVAVEVLDSLRLIYQAATPTLSTLGDYRFQVRSPTGGFADFTGSFGGGPAGNNHNVQLNRNGNFYGSDSLLYNGLGLVNLSDYIGRSLKLSDATASIHNLYIGGVKYLSNYGPTLDNLWLGKNAGSTSVLATNSQNIAIGINAMQNVQSQGNIAIGTEAARDLTSAIDPTGDSKSIYIGHSAGLNATGGQNNIGIGSNALQRAANGSFSNTVTGKATYAFCTDCNANSIYGASIGNKHGTWNAQIGADQTLNDTIGSFNSLVGAWSMTNNITGSNNAAVGYTSLGGNTTGNHNVGFGDHAGSANQTGSFNIFLGDFAGGYNTSDSYQYIVHSENKGSVGKAIIGGDLQLYRAAINVREDSVRLLPYTFQINGNMSLHHTNFTADTTNHKPIVWNTTTGLFERSYWAAGGGATTPAGNNNNLQINRNGAFYSPLLDTLTYRTDSGLIVRNDAFVNSARIGRGLAANITNTVFGVLSGNSFTSATNNTFMGYHSGLAATSGGSNTGFGQNVLAALNTGTTNTAMGNGVLGLLQGGSSNVAIGASSMVSAVSTSNTTAVGTLALQVVTGNNNTAQGYQAGLNVTTGTGNAIFGYNTGIGITTGTGNTILGASITGLASGLTNNIQIASGGGVKALHDGTNWTLTGSTTLTNGNLTLGTAGNKINITTGTNASAGVSAAMTAGSITISTTAVTANSIIILTPVGAGTGSISKGTVTAGTSFVINSSDGADTRTVQWLIIN